MSLLDSVTRHLKIQIRVSSQRWVIVLDFLFQIKQVCIYEILPKFKTEVYGESYAHLTNELTTPPNPDITSKNILIHRFPFLSSQLPLGGCGILLLIFIIYNL